jgi:hypothetical protein
MPSAASLAEFEQLVLPAIMRLDDGAYGTAIRREISVRTDRDPAPLRGGRAKRYFRVSAEGLQVSPAFTPPIGRFSKV